MYVNRRLEVEIDDKPMTLVVKSLGTGLCVLKFGVWYSVTHMASGKFIHKSRSEQTCFIVAEALTGLLDWTQPESEIVKHTDQIIKAIGAINYATLNQ